MFAMKSEVIGRSTVVRGNLVEIVDQKFVKDSSSQLQNFHALFSPRLSQLG
jgi:hypothetical protein